MEKETTEETFAYDLALPISRRNEDDPIWVLQT